MTYAAVLLAMFLPLCVSSLQASSPVRNKCVSTEKCWPSDSELKAFGTHLTGNLVLPADEDWTKAIHLKNKRLNGVLVPGAVVMAKSDLDVVDTMRFVASFNLELSVKSTGHCYSGNCMTPGSMHIDLTQMQNITLDTSAMVLTTQTGANFAQMYALCDQHGVLISGGMCPTVAPAGFALGGGHGPLIRSLGLGADNILSIDMVTANATQVTASLDQNSDLFWALRGGGGGAFGVVTSMRFRVHAAPKQLVSMSCAWPLSHDDKRVGEPILAEWMQNIMPNLPDEWTFYTVTMKTPLGPSVPHFNYLTMTGLLIVEGLYNGVYDQKMLDSINGLQQLGKPEQIKCELKNYSSFKLWHDQAWFADEGPIPFRTYMASSFAQPNFDRTKHAKLLTDTVLALPIDAVNMFYAVQLGGKVSRPDSNTSVSSELRSALMMQENDSDWNFEHADENQIKWAQTAGDAVAALPGFGGAYLNEPDPEKGKGEFESLFWGDHFSALQGVKRKWDSNATFDCHQCVYN